MTPDQVRQARTGLGLLTVTLGVYVAAGLALLGINLAAGMTAMAVWNAGWLLFAPWLAGWSAYELRRSSRALRSLR